MGSAPSAPPPPDPYAVAAAQGAQNRMAGVDQSRMNNVSQYTPYGSIVYTEKPREGINGSMLGGVYIPQFEARTTLSPAMQKLLDSNLANSQATSGVESGLLKNASANIQKPLDLSYGATEENLNRLGRNTLDPQFEQQKLQLNQQLANQGLTPGSEGWNYAQKAFGQNQASAYNDLYLRGHGQAVSDIMNQYNSPINTLSALRGNTQVSQPGIGALAPTAQSAINPPDLQGAVYKSYDAQMQNAQMQAQSQNAMLGGLFGLGGSLLGGLGKLSDRRDKKDIEKLGKDPETGLTMHAYRYKSDKPNVVKTVGPMAQDVEKKYPGSTEKIGGHMVIKRGFGIGGK